MAITLAPSVIQRIGGPDPTISLPRQPSPESLLRTLSTLPRLHPLAMKRQERLLGFKDFSFIFRTHDYLYQRGVLEGVAVNHYLGDECILVRMANFEAAMDEIRETLRPFVDLALDHGFVIDYFPSSKNDGTDDVEDMITFNLHSIKQRFVEGSEMHVDPSIFKSVIQERLTKEYIRSVPALREYYGRVLGINFRPRITHDNSRRILIALEAYSVTIF